jgi:hypothetical protein
MHSSWSRSYASPDGIEAFVRDSVSQLTWVRTQHDSTIPSGAFVSPPPRDWDPWSGDRGTPLSEIRTICEQLGPIATGLAPRFVAERYSIEVEASSTGAHVFLSSVGGRMSDQGGALRIPLAQASSGVVIWTGQALSLALSRLGTALEFGGDRARGGPPLDVFVIDEPERHLHPLAQEDVAAWLGERIREGALVFLATHALPFLDLPWDGVEYLRIVREPSGQARLVPVTQDPIGELSRHSDEAGYRPVQLLQLTRGLLIVEGQHDRKVIEHFYGRELRRARIRILQLQGYQEALALTDANFLLQLGLPIALLLDDIRTEEVEAFRRKRWGGNRRSNTEKMLQTLAVLLRDADRVSPVAFPVPDVLAALPEGPTGEVLRRHGVEFPGWRALIAGYRDARRGTGGKGFKDFFAERLGLADFRAGAFIDEVLDLAEPAPVPGTPLHDAIQAVLAQLGGTPDLLPEAE